ncbi:uncharacterized protein N7473_009319 [Penicillium subrubescens]|uniref:Ecp2 effector protein domain-containing protein n=1 Tax=Penicillium subrubescens TaxID=1316194 RepID=A0A1Q5TAT8_9EURO|nr:uncharacterized protein N7473_009319 [Penicillium subrubescens]KAJ5886645.1 hypothetical protein N7473_009319 [Penicillium subrubescens]OKO97313.1 hypothetical protein PENSUB_10107 [Penicillium subrubescens]
MRFLGAWLVGVYAMAVAAVPHVPREILAYRAWDLRLLSTAIPTCNPNDSNIDVSIYHRSGRYDTTCQALEADYNATNVKSLSYKSPSEDDWHDLCMFSTADCSGGKSALLGSITDGWEVCYPYNGFRGWSVVAHGTACV